MSPEWIRLSHDGLDWRIRQGEEKRIMDRDWTPPGEDRPGLRVMQRWGSRTSALWAAAPGEAGVLFVKWYGPRHAGEGLKYLFKPSRPAVEWRMNGRLARAGVPVVECLAAADRRTAGWWRGGVLVLKAVVPPTTLGDYLRTAGSGEAAKAADRAAALVARLHETGFCHHDLHGENILVEQAGGRMTGLRLADLHEVEWRRRLPDPLRLADLARLNGYTPGGRRARLRFWARYAAVQGLDRPRKREWLRAIDRETRMLWERHFRKRGERIELY